MFCVTRGDVLRFASHLPLALIFRAVGAVGLIIEARAQQRQTLVNARGRDGAVAEEEAGARWNIEGEFRQSLDLHAQFGCADSDVADLIDRC